MPTILVVEDEREIARIARDYLQHAGFAVVSANDGVDALTIAGARHPDLVIELSATDVVEDVLNRAADIAIRMTEPTQNALLARYVGAIPLGLHAHRRYLDRHGLPTGLEELVHHCINLY